MQQSILFTRLAAVAVTLIGTVLALPSAQADDPEFPGVVGPKVATSQLGLGIAVADTEVQYRGKDNSTSLIPLILYDNQYLHVFGNTVDLKLPSLSHLHFAVRAKYALGDGYKASQSDYLYGMAERKGGLWLGGAASWDSQLVTLSASWTKATNDSKGQQFEVNAEHGFRSGRFQLTPHVGVVRSDKKYVDYYYGVRPDEVRADRPAYAGTDAATEVSAGVRVNYALSRQQMLLLDVSDTHRGSAITDSPLVDKASTPSVKAGYLYLF